jgi:hypothetical protein
MAPGITHEHQQQDKQGRHQQAHGSFQPTAHPTRNHHHGHHHEEGMPGKQAFRITGETGKDTLYPVCRLPGKQATAGTEHVGERPAGDHAVIGEDQESRQHTGPAQPLPVPADAFLGSEGAHGIDRTLAPAPAQHDFGHHDRNTDDGDTARLS